MRVNALLLPDSGGSLKWPAVVAGIHSAVLEACIGQDRTVVWIQWPLPADPAEMRNTLLFLHQAFQDAPEWRAPAVILAYRHSDLPEGALPILVKCSTVVVQGHTVLPRCPSWLLAGDKFSPTPTTPAVHVFPGAGLPWPTDLARSEGLSTLGQFAAGIAHELGNPLSIISSSLQYLRDRLVTAGDPGADFTTTALDSVERMRILLRNTLDLAVARKSGPEPINVNEVVREILRLTAEECARHSIEIEASLGSSLPRVWADRGGVAQILLNLIRNTFDALGERGGRLAVRTREVPDTGQVFVEAENDGPPIPSDLLPRLFQPFRTTKPSGTGLGLYLSREMAREWGGDIAGENLARGVRFTLMLHADRSEVADGARPGR